MKKLFILLLIATFFSCGELVDAGLQLSKTDDAVIESLEVSTEEVSGQPAQTGKPTPIKPVKPVVKPTPVASAPATAPNLPMESEEDTMLELGSAPAEDAIDLVDIADAGDIGIVEVAGNPVVDTPSSATVNNNGDAGIIVTLDADAIEDAVGDPKLRRIEAVKAGAEELLEEVNADYTMATSLKDDIGGYLGDANEIYDVGVARLRKITEKSTREIEGYLQEARIIYTGVVAEITDVKASLHKIMQEANTDIDFAEIQLGNARITVAGFDAEINLIAAQTTLATASIEAIEEHMSSMTTDFTVSIGLANQEIVDISEKVVSLMGKKAQLLMTIAAFTPEQRGLAASKITKVMTAVDSLDAAYLTADTALESLTATSNELQQLIVDPTGFARSYKISEELDASMKTSVLDSYRLYRLIKENIAAIEAIAS